MDGALASPAGSRAPSSTPATPLEEQFDGQTQPHPGSVSGGSVGTAGAAKGVRKTGDGACETHERAQTTQKDASGHDASQQQEGPAPKRIKKEFGGEKWTREEELALLEIRKGQGGATWEGTPEKLVAKGFAKRSVTALKQRWQAMDGASGSPRPATEQDKSWTNDQLLALTAIVTHQDSVPGFRKNPIDWSSWQSEFPGKTKYQLKHKAADLRKVEENAKLKDQRHQADKAAREAAIEAKWRSLQAEKGGGGQADAGAGPSTTTSAADDTPQTLDEIIAACSATGPAATFAPLTVEDVQMPSGSCAMHSFSQTLCAQPPFHEASFGQLDSFRTHQRTTASPRPIPHHPSTSTMSSQLDAYLDFAIDAALSTTSPVPPPQNTRPHHPPNHTMIGQSNSAQRLPQSAFVPREQQHQPISAAANVSPALPAKQPVVAAEIAKLIVDVTGQTASQRHAAPAHEPAEEKREEPRWRTDLGDEEDTSWVPKSKAGMKLEAKLRGIERRLRE
ncbi:hypothetical protein JCM10049v2_007630 [Rhodotorula toruloides]